MPLVNIMTNHGTNNNNNNNDVLVMITVIVNEKTIPTLFYRSLGLHPRC